MPRDGLRQIGQDIYIAKSLFSVGTGCCGDLTITQLHQRLKEAVARHPEALQSGLKQESTPEQLKEEQHMIDRLHAGEPVDLKLDTTMTIIAFEGKLMIHSPCPLTDCLKQEIAAIGTVSAIVAPNLQHWLSVAEYHAEWPDATVYVAPADPNGEDLSKKLEGIPTTELQDGVAQIHSSVQQRLLRGAALYMNEFVFYHQPSQTVIASDSYYGGYSRLEEPEWFGRIWFKCTKGSFRQAGLPIYRTARVLSHGNIDELMRSLSEPALLGCRGGMLEEWVRTGIKALVCAHGTAFWPAHPQQQFLKGWRQVLQMRAAAAPKAANATKIGDATTGVDSPVSSATIVQGTTKEKSKCAHTHAGSEAAGFKN